MKNPTPLNHSLKDFYTRIDRKVLRIFALGFVSGLPFLLTLSTLSYWLAEEGISKTAIGLFMIVSLPYSFKFIWAPLTDHVAIPYLTRRIGNRRSWLLSSQILLTLSIFIMGFCDPSKSLFALGCLATCVSFFSATQDIVIDAYRIETICQKNCGTAAAFETIGFRFGMLISGAGALYLAHLVDWKTAYHAMACLSACTILLTLSIPEPTVKNLVKIDFQKSYRKLSERLTAYLLLPIRQFNAENNLSTILLFIFFFKLTDTILNSMSAPFLCDIGFSKIEFANVSKVFGISLMVIGGLLGGLMIQRLGIYQSAVMCVALQAMSTLMFTIQALVGYDTSVLIITVGAESLCSGMTSTIFIALLSGFCMQPHTASHFTLLYSFGSLSRVCTSALAGWLADHIAWPLLFLGCFGVLVPTILLLNKILLPEESLASSQSKQSVA
ncbi:MAG: MFS transporter [Candidatus Paracaedibacteraceae bacterium]|nr:MFS transporter [Candidatus Paracaedibacteraceae bacterium]